MSRLLAGLIPILLLAPIALEAQAPLQPESIVAWVAPEPVSERAAGPVPHGQEHLAAMLQPPAHTAVVTLVGSGLGLGLGAAAGMVIGLAIDGPRGSASFPLPPPAALLASAGGMTAGSWTGARLGNRHRGDPWMTAAGSVSGLVAGLGFGILAGSLSNSDWAGLAVGLPIAISLPAIAELATTPVQ